MPTEAAGADPFGFSPWLKEMPAAAIPPLMAHPVAAMAAATAIGFGLTSHFAGMVLGAMQGAAERAKGLLDEAEAKASARAEAPKPEPARAAVASAAVTPAEAGTKRKPATVRKGSGSNAGRTDDLKMISGIGPKLEQVLNGKGIFRFADIARWAALDVERIEAELGLDGRIARDGWVEQAKKLAKAKG
ncbi:NADH:ubiquinone oxidoreductase [Rhizobium sp. ARZ01]|nr:NADH:ubiquinone oxidoreductase [Rhizobium sp. ARZ01]